MTPNNAFALIHIMQILFLFLGVLLEKLPTTNIFENSTMNRSLCVRLIDIGEGLQRSVHVSVMFIPNLFPYAEESKSDFNIHTCQCLILALLSQI